MSTFKDVSHYLPVSSVEVGWGTYLAGAGSANITPDQSYPPKGHPSLYDFKWQRGRTLPEFQMLLIRNGKGIFESEGTGVVEFDSGALIFLFPDVWHRYKPDSTTGWQERWVSFNGELIHRFFGSQLLTPKNAVALISQNQEQSLATRYDELLARVNVDPTVNSILYSIHLLSLVAEGVEMARLTQSAKATKPGKSIRDDEDPIVKRTLEIIWTHGNRQLSVEEIARHLPVTRRTLDRRFTKATGRTVLEEINRCRIARAKRLLRETSVPIKALAQLSGFYSQERLRVSFLASEGISPSEFRARYGAHAKELQQDYSRKM